MSATTFAQGVVAPLRRRVDQARLGRRRLRFVAQSTASECGLASLAMALAALGREVPLATLRKLVGPIHAGGGGGVTLAQLAQAASRFDVLAQGYQVELEGLAALEPGAILHWDMNHFVVLGRSSATRVEIFDPAIGRRDMTLEAVSEHFTGIALCLRPSQNFVGARHRERPLWPHLRRVLNERRALGAALLCSLVLQVLGFALPAGFALAIEELIPWREARGLELLGLGLAVSGLASMWAQVVRGRTLTQMDVELEADMRSSFLFHLLHLPYRFHTSLTTGDIIQRVNSHGRIRDALAGLALSAVLDAALALCFFAALVWLVPRVALIIALLAAAHALVVRSTRGLRERLMTEYLHADAKCQAQQIEMIQNIYSIKAMGRELPMLQRWSASFVDVLRNARRRGNLQIGLLALGPLISTLVPAAVVTYAGYAVIQGEMSVGALFAVSALAPAFMTPVAALVAAVEGLAEARSVAIRVNDVLAETSELAPVDDDHDGLGGRARSPGAHTLVGALSFSNVDFAYDPQRPILSGFSLDIPAGAMVALVGPTGSGKSTLAKLMLGLQTPDAGELRIDGRPLASLDIVGLRRQVGVVPQRVELLDGSLRSNISFGLDVGQADIERAARVALIHDRIMEEASGYEALVSEGGSSLSGGEAQRLALARALVGRPKLLILDEATSALDTHTEAEVHRRLGELPCTKIVIAHRLSTVRGADCIVVMDRGKIVEQGTHAALIERDGHYARLVAAQMEAG